MHVISLLGYLCYVPRESQGMKSESGNNAVKLQKPQIPRSPTPCAKHPDNSFLEIRNLHRLVRMSSQEGTGNQEFQARETSSQYRSRRITAAWNSGFPPCPIHISGYGHLVKSQGYLEQVSRLFLNQSNSKTTKHSCFSGRKGMISRMMS